MSKARDIASANPAPSNVSSTELGYLDGVSSNIQTQFSNISGSKAQPDEPVSPTDGMIWVDTNGAVTDAQFIEKSITTTKGDLISATAVNTPARLGVGSNNQVLTADSSTATGLKWATPSAGAGNMVQIATGSLSGTSVTISSLSNYTDLLIFVSGVMTGGNYNLRFRLNNNSGSNYFNLSLSSAYLSGSFERNMEGNYTAIDMPDSWQFSQYNNGNNDWFLKFTNCKNAGFTDYNGIAHVRSTGNNVNDRYMLNLKGVYQQSEAISSLVITTMSGATFTNGTYTLWGA